MSQALLPFLIIDGANDDAPCLFDDNSDGNGLSYADVRKKVEALATCFLAHKKSLVFLCVTQTVETVVTYLAVARAGHAVAMIDRTFHGFDTLLETYKPEWVVLPTGDVTLPGYHRVDWDPQGLSLWQRAEFTHTDIHPDLFLLLMTSGSTGSKRAVRLSYKNIAQNTKSIIDSLSLKKGERALLHLPLSYSFGLSVLHCQLASGGSCVLTEHRMMNQLLWQQVRTRCVTLFPGVPYHYDMLDKLNLSRLNVPDLHIFLQAGGKLNDATALKILNLIQERKGQFFIMYGQTEASPRIACFPLHTCPKKLGSVGQVLHQGRVTIEADEIIYHGPNVMMGYAQSRGDLGVGDVMQGRLATGDIGRLDEDAYLYILGRRERFAKPFGVRVNLSDLERMVQSLAEVHAVEVNNKIILVTLIQNPEIIAQIKSHILENSHLSAGWLDIRTVSSLPRHANGKIDYIRLKELL